MFKSLLRSLGFLKEPKFVEKVVESYSLRLSLRFWELSLKLSGDDNLIYLYSFLPDDFKKDELSQLGEEALGKTFKQVNEMIYKINRQKLRVNKSRRN